MKYILLAIFLCFEISSFAQHSAPKLEVYVSPGFFLETLSKDSLIPAKRQSVARIGDVVSFAMQVAVPLKNDHFTIKAGVGLSTRHYSINKYSLDDIFVSLFLFDSQLRRDSSKISYVRFTNKYFQLPLSAVYRLTNLKSGFQLTAGLNLKTDFLTTSNAQVDFDSYKIPTQQELFTAKNEYTKNASKIVVTIEPVVEGSFMVYKNYGLLFQVRPFSFFSSQLDRHLTTSTVEIFSSTFGVFYKFK